MWCIIPAAGSGQRMASDVPKQYLPVLGQPLLLRTMERVAAHPAVSGLMVVLARADRRWPGIDRCGGKPVRTTIGGATRADSVLAGIDALADVAPEQWVLVHDAARPALRLADLSRLIEAGTRHPTGAILATPVADTLKRARADGTIEATVPRENVWRAMTPQLFRLGDLREALTCATRAQTNTNLDLAPSDDANALEVRGKFPLLVEGCADNLKLTRSDDLALLEAILRTQGEQ
jgi:2-C-methyl-D-erythritol 4-phosphate cytidylyltransferase